VRSDGHTYKGSHRNYVANVRVLDVGLGAHTMHASQYIDVRGRHKAIETGSQSGWALGLQC
jgi:hypothetical protein